MDETENGNMHNVRQESPCSNEVEGLQDGCGPCCPLRMRVMTSAPTTKALERVLGGMEMQMLRWTIGVTPKDKVSNHTVRSIFGVVGVVPIGEKMKEGQLRWFGHVLWREENPVAKTALKPDV
ncbi:hypothetical protein RB195_005542 [Necator americanus]|uniref:Uncharacterized protein n=1 Tax=Necator americanus TaxID=51031 RepID=A0ABR1BNF4_NECAM